MVFLRGPDRQLRRGRGRQDPNDLRLRDYLVNLISAHQKLDFKDGAYRVPFQASPDLLVLERAGKALIALNDNGIAAQSATVPTGFGPNVRLHDYSGSKIPTTSPRTGRDASRSRCRR